MEPSSISKTNDLVELSTFWTNFKVSTVSCPYDQVAVLTYCDTSVSPFVFSLQCRTFSMGSTRVYVVCKPDDRKLANIMKVMNGFQAMQGFLRVFGVEGPNGVFHIQVHESEYSGCTLV